MRKSKLVPIFAGCIIVLGLILAGVGYALGANHSIVATKDGLKVIDSNDFKIENKALESFNQIEVDVTDVNIQFVASDSPKIEIRSLKDLSKHISYKVENNKLIVKHKEDSEAVFSFFNFSIGGIPQTKIIVYVPKNVSLEKVSITNDFGDIHFADLKANQLDVKTTDGDLSFANIDTDSFTIKNRFGDITASNIKTNTLTTEMNDGDLEFHTVIAKTTNMTNRFGDMDLSDFRSEGLTMKSNDGDIEIQGVLQGMTSITSHFGDVDVETTNQNTDLSYSISNNFGDITVNNNNFDSKAEHTANNSKHKIMIDANDGDVSLQF